MLSFGRFGVGLAATVVVIAGVVLAARAVRTRVLPGWSGPPAAVADAVLGLTLLTAVAEVLGALDLLRPLPVLVGELGAAAAVLVVATRIRTRPAPAVGEDTPPPPGARRSEVVAAGIATSVVVVQWATHVGDAIDRGMVYSDTLWYHQPFAARFVQHGSFDVLDGVGLEAARLYPLGSPLLHALGMLAFDRDVLSPFLNLAWLALCLVAAWSIGRRTGHAHLCVLGAATVAGLPILAATQPGQASSDIGALALLLSGIALLLERRDGGAAHLAVAGLALGLALSMKITVAVPLAVIAVGVLVVHRRDRPRALAWIGGLTATGAFWFGRSWALVGSPLPWFDLRLGPIHLRPHRGAEAAASGEPALARSITDGDAWRDIYVHGLWHGFGRLWPLVLLVAVGAIVALVVRGSSVAARLAGAACGIGLLAYVVTPYTGRLNFASGLRFLAPLLIVALVLAPTVLPSTTRWRRAQLAVLCLVVAVGVTMPTFERVPTWPTGTGALVVGGVVIALAAALVWRRDVGAGIAMAVVVAGSWFAQDAYLQHRYVDAGLPTDALNEHFRSVRDSSVAVFGTDDTFPMFGLDLSNDVRRGDDPPFALGPEPCRTWREHLDGDDYVVIAGTPDAFGLYPAPPPEVFDDPAARLVVADGADVVYRLDGPFTSTDCRAPLATQP